MLGQIIIYNEDVLALAHEILADGSTDIRCNVLLRRRICRGRGYDNTVIQRTGLFQCAAQLGNRRCLLTDGNVDTNHVLTLLVQDGVNRDGCFTGLAVADD